MLTDCEAELRKANGLLITPFMVNPTRIEQSVLYLRDGLVQTVDFISAKILRLRPLNGL